MARPRTHRQASVIPDAHARLFNRPRRWVWRNWGNRLGACLRAERVFLGLGLVAFALSCSACEAGGQPTPNVTVFVAKELRPPLDSAFKRFETTPDADRYLCIDDAHVIPSEVVDGRVVVLLFAASLSATNCGRRPVLIFDLRCADRKVDTARLAHLGIPWIGFLCRKPDNALWVWLIMAQPPERTL